METKEDNNILKAYNMLLLFAGSMVLYEPTKECVVDFWKNGLLKQLPVNSRNPRFINAASQLKESVESVHLCVDELQDDYRRLFPANHNSLVPVRESVYRKKEMPDSLQMEEVSAFYDAYGWVSKLRSKEDDDHLAIEILFLTRLIEKYLTLDDEPCKIEMGKEIRRFIDQHLLSWIPLWNDMVQQHANTLCYKGIGTLIHACIEDINNVLAYVEKSKV